MAKNPAAAKSKTTRKSATQKSVSQTGAMFQGRTFDVLPDRIDLRDRPYAPRLVSLFKRYPTPAVIELALPRYESCVLDQGTEGACTGFGLAAVINYLEWTRYWRTAAMLETDLDALAMLFEDERNHPHPAKRVSQRMLYQMAKRYDEWEGEDYSGSSCRGAMKGWNKHGVCLETTWPYEPDRFIRPTDGWDEEAREVPLGAYYRIDTESINDMQSAIFEIGAIYVSAEVHDGWELPAIKKWERALIKPPRKPDRGGHAFCLVGFNEIGWIIQNSWGPDWGYHGFAVLRYDDWMHHGIDAWAAALGAPITSEQEAEVATAGAEGEHLRVRQIASKQRLATGRQSSLSVPTETAPWPDFTARDYTVIQGDDGRAVNSQPTSANAEQAVEQTCRDLPTRFFNADQRTNPRLLFFAHGGLNSAEDSMKRIRVLGPYFAANKVFPIFYTWRTGIEESISRLVAGRVDEWIGKFRASRTAEFDLSGIRERMRRAQEWVGERWDAAIEAGSRHAVKPIWSDMKQASAVGTGRGRALRQIVQHWTKLQQDFPKLEIHLAGHSAGSLVLGELLSVLQGAGLQAASCTLWAPACTVDFAFEKYRPAIQSGVLEKKQFTIHVLRDRLEREDTVGPYKKSLLYLVSRALEPNVRAPLLGMEWGWKRPTPGNDSPWLSEGDASVQKWLGFWGNQRPRILDAGTVFDGARNIRTAHGTFDNDVAIVEQLIRQVTGRAPKLRVTNLTNF